MRRCGEITRNIESQHRNTVNGLLDIKIQLALPKHDDPLTENKIFYSLNAEKKVLCDFAKFLSLINYKRADLCVVIHFTHFYAYKSIESPRKWKRRGEEKKVNINNNFVLLCLELELVSETFNVKCGSIEAVRKYVLDFTT